MLNIHDHAPVNAPAVQAGCPKRVVFVLKETEPEAWISNGGDFSAYLKPPGVDEVVDRVRICLCVLAIPPGAASADGESRASTAVQFLGMPVQVF